jgi:hypothetical protein
LTLLSTRLRATLLGGRVGLRGVSTVRRRGDDLLEPRERVGAILVLAAVALRLDDDDAVGGDSLVVAREEPGLDLLRAATMRARRSAGGAPWTPC